MNHLKWWVDRPGPACSLADDPTTIPSDELPWQGTPPEGERPHFNLALSLRQITNLEHHLIHGPKVFSRTPGEMRVIEHIIPTQPGQVTRASWRPIPRKRWAELEREPQDMLALGVIEPSRSEWHNPIMLVPKPDGSTRFCIDYQELNKVAQFDATPCRGRTSSWSSSGQPNTSQNLTLQRGIGRCWCVPRTDQRLPSPPHRASSNFAGCPSDSTGWPPPSSG